MTELSLPKSAGNTSLVHRIAAIHVAGRGGAVAHWLWSVAALVFLMVVVGGATRLTESGLSITEWKPVTGVIPPLSHTAWLEAFGKYKQIPQYAALFPQMDLAQFQTIFLWEWTHRLIGRLLGFALLVPLVVFWVRGRLLGALKWRLVGILVLIGFQGFIGWWMVSSGLAGRIEVAPERLATHLVLASLTLTALVWLAVSQRGLGAQPASPGFRILAGVILAACLLQIGMGGLVAGLRAGQAYNTWPLMNGRFVPPLENLTLLSPLWRNLAENLTMVQFQHRTTAYLLFALALVQLVWTRRARPGTPAARRSIALGGLVTLQAGLGILTLVLAVPLWAGLLHQSFAMIVLIMATVHLQRLTAFS